MIFKLYTVPVEPYEALTIELKYSLSLPGNYSYTCPMTDIVIPIYTPRVPESFLKCVESIYKNTEDFNLIIAGSDQKQPVNVNRGLDRAKSEFVAILDWDTIVPGRWLKILTKNLAEDPSIGIIGAKMIGAYVGTNRDAEPGVQEWPTLAGGCVVFRNIGIRWDERFPSGYWADTDFCRQFKEQGLKCCINGDVEVEHFPNTFGTQGDQVAEWSAQGAEIYKAKWGNNEF